MPSIFRSLFPIKPTSKGRESVRTENFLRSCQAVAFNMLKAGKTWDDIDARLRVIVIRELMPRRGEHTADEAADFYRRYYELVDGAWLPAVLKIKEAWLQMAADPRKFLRSKGIIPPTPPGMPSDDLLDNSRGGMPVPKNWVAGVHYKEEK